MIVHPPLHHAAQPLAQFPDRQVHPFPQFDFNRLKLGSQALADAAPLDLEDPIAVGTAIVGESQKVENFRFALASSSPIFFGKSAEFDQSRFLRVQLQAELCHPRVKLAEESLGIGPVLKSHDKVVCIADDDDISACIASSPLVRPKVEYVMQVDVRQER